MKKDKTKPLRKYRYQKKLKNCPKVSPQSTISTKAIAEQGQENQPVRDKPLLKDNGGTLKFPDDVKTGPIKGADEVKGGNGSTPPPPLLTLVETELLELGATREGLATWAAALFPHHAYEGFARVHIEWFNLLYSLVESNALGKRRKDIDGSAPPDGGGGGVAPSCGDIENLLPPHFLAPLETNISKSLESLETHSQDTEGEPTQKFEKAQPAILSNSPVKSNTNDVKQRTKVPHKLKSSRHIRKLAIAAPRGHAKTTILMLFALWCICYRMKKFIVLISDSEDQAKLQLDAIKAELENNELLKRLYGNLVGRNWATEAIETSTGIRVQCRGAGQRIRGLKFREQRPDLIVCDDLLNDELVETDERRAKLKRWFFGAVVPAIAKGGGIVVVGTILHEADLLSELLESGAGWETRLYSALTDGVALWPEQFDKEHLDEIRQEFEEKGELSLFFREYFNQIVGNEDCPFQREYFHYLTNAQYLEKVKNVKTYITVDPAYTRHNRADYTAFCVVSIDPGRRWYVRKILRGRWTQPQIINTLFDLYDLYHPFQIGIQKQDWGRVFKHPVEDEGRRRNRHLPIRELQTYSPNTKGLANKSARIGRLAKYYNSSSIIHIKGKGIKYLEAELLSYPFAKNDDVSDALAMIIDLAFAPSKKVKKTLPSWYYHIHEDPISKY